MTVRRSLARITALIVVVAMPVMGMSGLASAQSAKAAAAKCAKHPTRAKCQNAGGGSTGTTGTGGAPVQITLQVDPQPLVETGQSEIHAVLQVETLASFAGDTVLIESSQLTASCGVVFYESLQIPGGGLQTIPPTPTDEQNQIGVVLDDDGNATVVVNGLDCAPGTSVISADLEAAPYLTALATLVASPPVVTPEGLTVYPRFGGLNQELETGDTTASGFSDIYAVFYVETSPVYAEQTVEIDSTQLEDRCGEGSVWEAGNPPNVAPKQVGPGIDDQTTTLDDDGNAVFIFEGASCAAGDSEVIADVEAGTHPTYVTDFAVLPPAPVI